MKLFSVFGRLHVFVFLTLYMMVSVSLHSLNTLNFPDLSMLTVLSLTLVWIQDCHSSAKEPYIYHQFLT